MDMDSEDEALYGPADPGPHQQSSHRNAEVKMEDAEDGEEEGEEVEDEDDSDDEVNFITDAPKEQPKAETPSQSKKQQTLPTAPSDFRKATPTPTPAVKAESPADQKQVPQNLEDKPGTEYPARHTSKLDPNGNPTLPATGKPVLSTDFDVDFPTESSKPWRKPGADITDFFNYGFDEFTWASYCLKQQQVPKDIKEINQQAEQMKAFVEGIPGGGMSGMPAAGAGAPAMPQMPQMLSEADMNQMSGMTGMPGMPGEAEMGQMMQAMMAQGMDPSNMDFSQFMQMMQSGGAQNLPGQNTGFGGGGGGTPQGPASMAYGSGGGFDRSGGHYGGRGRGRGRGRY